MLSNEPKHLKNDCCVFSHFIAALYLYIVRLFSFSFFNFLCHHWLGRIDKPFLFSVLFLDQKNDFSSFMITACYKIRMTTSLNLSCILTQSV